MTMDKLLFDAVINTQPDFIDAVNEALKTDSRLVIIGSDEYTFHKDHMMALGCMVKYANLRGLNVEVSVGGDPKRPIRFNQRFGDRRLPGQEA